MRPANCIGLFTDVTSCSDIKPFYLHCLPQDQEYMCPVRALAEWLTVSGNVDGYVFRKVKAGDRVDAENRPLVSFYYLIMILIVNSV